MFSRRLIELSPMLPSRVSRLEVCQTVFRSISPPVANAVSLETLTQKAQETAGVKGKEAEGKAKEVAGEAKGKAHELEGKAKGKAEELRSGR
jgi:hypothetical protein